ncbi:MAG: sterol desaturase family protein [Methylococcales bacterium]|nr:sterol desaturase family protein [Methylococcales bacterium]
MLNLTHISEIHFRWPSSLSGEVLALTLLIVFALLSTLESCAPQKKQAAKHLRLSYKTNISLFLVNSIALSLVSASSLFLLAERYSSQGLLNRLPSPALKAIVSFLMLDLLMYLWHRASHRFEWLWMFHKVHHNDPCLNVSTSFRIHFLELIITLILKALLIIVLGIGQDLLMGCEALMTVFILFHHSNIAFKGEKYLGKIIIVPALHRTHHSIQRHEHDSNYGAVLTLWDWLFGTLKHCNPDRAGIKNPSPLDLVNLIKFGFSLPVAPPTPAINLEAMIAEAAYYKAEKRGFYPGNEIRDWLEAKREIIALVYGDKALTKKSSGLSRMDGFNSVETNAYV